MGRQRYFLDLFVLAGILTMMLTLVGLIALIAVPIWNVLAIVYTKAYQVTGKPEYAKIAHEIFVYVTLPMHNPCQWYNHQYHFTA